MRVEEGWGNEQVPFQFADMKGKERIFMFTANIALKTKKRLKTQKENKAFLEIPKRIRPEGKQIHLTIRRKKGESQLKGDNSCDIPVECKDRAGSCCRQPCQHVLVFVNTRESTCLQRESIQESAKTVNRHQYAHKHRTKAEIFNPSAYDQNNLQFFLSYSHNIPLFRIRWSKWRPAEIWGLKRTDAKNWLGRAFVLPIWKAKVFTTGSTIGRHMPLLYSLFMAGMLQHYMEWGSIVFLLLSQQWR